MITTTERTKSAAKPRPAVHIQVGCVRIPIWKNVSSEDGKVFFTAGEPELSYKDGNGQWQKSGSYTARDLVNLMKAAALAHTEVLRHNRAVLPPVSETGDHQHAA